MGEAIVLRAERLLSKYWRAYFDLVQKALDHSLGELTPHDLFKRVTDGKVQLWAVYTFGQSPAKLLGLASTEVVDYGQYSGLRVITLAGNDMPSWQGALDRAFGKFCKEEGLRQIEAVGRRGLKRRLQPLGYRPVYTVYVREINEQERRDNKNHVNDWDSRGTEAVL